MLMLISNPTPMSSSQNTYYKGGHCGIQQQPGRLQNQLHRESPLHLNQFQPLPLHPLIAPQAQLIHHIPFPVPHALRERLGLALTTSPNLGPSSRSTSPAKGTATRPRASTVFQNTAIAGSSAMKLPTKPASPLASFNLTTQFTRPATSDVTVSLASGVIVQPPVVPASPTMTIASSQPSLLEEYTGETSGNELSTEMAVTLLVTMVDLEVDNIERVEDPNRSTTKYRLSESLLENLLKTTVELQMFVERAAGLLEERDSHFMVDPRDTLIQILKGTTSLPQLNVAWKTIQKRLELGHRTLQKYQLQYQQNPQEELLLSPISTVPELHNQLQHLPSADQRLCYMYEKFPHHHTKVLKEAELALSQGKSWLSVIPLPTTLRNTLTSEKEPPKERQVLRAPKGKHRERKEDVDDEEVEHNPSDRIWLGAETLFKGPNKWFGGGRLKSRGSTSSQTTLGATKSNQNVLFGLAMPQLPIWATDPSNPPSGSKQPRASRGLEQSEKWSNHDLPPHLSTTVRAEQLRNANIPRKSVRGDPPDDDDDDDEETPNRGRHDPSASQKGSSNSSHSSGCGHHRGQGGGPPSEPSDGDGDSEDSEASSGTSRAQRKREAKATIPYGSIKPTIKAELKQEQLLRWDGNPSMAVKYFLRIQQLATLEGDLPQALGYWLWMNLEDRSDIKDWFATLTYEEQAHMRSHYIISSYHLHHVIPGCYQPIS